MTRLSIVAAILFTAWLSATTVTAQEKQAEEFAVIGYLPDYRLGSFDLGRLGPPLTDVVAFSIEPKADGSLDARRLKDSDLRRLREATAKKGIRLHVALGGWERSGGFAAMSTDPRIRKRFIEALTAFCREHKLDGVDFDWEHPATPAEEAGYAALLDETSRAFRPLKLRTSVTLAAWQKTTPEALRAVDRVHVMAYDHDGPHATAEDAAKDVEMLARKGAPRDRLVLGVPFYGRDLKDRGRAAGYGEILAKHHPAADVDEVDGLYFNGPKTIAAKVRKAKADGLAGVMIWELGQDAEGDGSLLKVIGRTVGSNH